ncbi:MAG: hypothetical protein M0C28_39860 [Candidatus Moduliflexus flocculans]|nr:hypothetical protein [Candidatus Moduliflexus flocculans]
MTVTLRASKDSPAVNPALRIRNWDAPLPRVEIDGRPRAARQGRPGRVDTRSRRRRPRPLDPGRMDLARPDLDRSGRRDRQSGVAMNRRMRLSGWAAGLIVLAGPLTAALTFEPGEYAARRARFMEKIRDGAAVFLGALGARIGRLRLPPGPRFRLSHRGPRSPNAFLVVDGLRKESVLFFTMTRGRGGRARASRSTSSAIAKAVTGDRAGPAGRSVRPATWRACASRTGSSTRCSSPRRLGPENANEKFNALQRSMTLSPWDGRLTPGAPVRQAAARQVPRRPRCGTAPPLVWELRKIKSPAELERHAPGGPDRRPGPQRPDPRRPGPASRRRRWPPCSSSSAGSTARQDLAYATIIMSGQEPRLRALPRLRPGAEGRRLRHPRRRRPTTPNYHVDISTSFPASGTFSPRQKELYEVGPRPSTTPAWRTTARA